VTGPEGAERLVSISGGSGGVEKYSSSSVTDVARGPLAD